MIFQPAARNKTSGILTESVIILQTVFISYVLHFCQWVWILSYIAESFVSVISIFYESTITALFSNSFAHIIERFS